jgi:protein phosphatase 2C family protein 2/3
VVLIVETRCFIANVGDSRTIMSGNNGGKVYTLSRDHRPNDEKEYKRVLDAGGKIYQTEANIENYSSNSSNYKTLKNPPSVVNILGPLRVFPGKLSVSRTIGDIEAKDQSLGGNPNVIIALPEIKYFDITCKNDFILIGCDGLFEKMKNNEIIEKIWRIIDDDKSNHIMDIHHLNGIIVQNVVEECISKKSTDNLTAVMICFRNDFKFSTVQTDINHPSMTQQLNKVPKLMKHHMTEEKPHYINNLTEQKNILSKIIKKTQLLKNNEDNSNHYHK